MSTLRVIKILKEKKISFTTGGYISAPTIVAAKLLKIPIILHESNLLHSKITNILVLCGYVFTGFEGTNYC